MVLYSHGKRLVQKPISYIGNYHLCNRDWVQLRVALLIILTIYKKNASSEFNLALLKGLSIMVRYRFPGKRLRTEPLFKIVRNNYETHL